MFFRCRNRYEAKQGADLCVYAMAKGSQTSVAEQFDLCL